MDIFQFIFQIVFSLEEELNQLTYICNIILYVVYQVIIMTVVSSFCFLVLLFLVLLLSLMVRETGVQSPVESYQRLFYIYHRAKVCFVCLFSFWGCIILLRRLEFLRCLRHFELVHPNIGFQIFLIFLQFPFKWMFTGYFPFLIYDISGFFI